MNDGSSKNIFFNKSSLFSLKAELLRKQEEVKEKRQLPQNKLENFKPPPAKPKTQDKDVKKEYKKTFKDSLKAVDTEELEAFRKSKLALEKKAALYEHLNDSAGNSELASRFLVDFNTKKLQEPVKVQEPVKLQEPEKLPEAVPIEPYDEEDDDDDSEWTEFTDCLGRTRKCLKTEKELFLKRDADLMRTLNRERPGSNEDQGPQPEGTLEDEKPKPLLVQTTNEYLQSLREKWEQKERELLAKDKDIHYQDLLFDEARTHGVGYFSFSTDEAERKQQMDDLLKRREETLQAQKEAELARKKRDEIMAAREAASRARERVKAGLPPEEPPEEKPKDLTTSLLEFLTQQKNEADAKAKEEENKLKEEQEKEKQRLRDEYIREWDLGKEGVEAKVKKFKLMSQEEYVEQQRDKRIKEFAPPKTSTSGNSIFDDKGNKVVTKEVTATKTWADVRPRAKTPPPPEIGDLNEIPLNKGLYFSTSKKNEGSSVKYRNFVKAQEPTPIVDELEDTDSEASNTRIEKRKHDSNSVEVPPPPTFEYYGPTIKQTRFEKPFESDIREAYSQGAKSLETKSSGRKLPQHYDFTFD